MAYVNVAEWKPDQVTDWLKGLDAVVVPHIHSFQNKQINGQQLLNISPDDLEILGVYKLGHQELILEAVEHLRNFHYELDRETLQLLALRVSCLAHSLYNDLRRNHSNSHLVSTQTLSDVAHIVMAVKPLVCWLDRPPFNGHLEYKQLKPELLAWSLEMATSGQRDRFAEHPVEEIRNSSAKLAKLADSLIQDTKDPLLLQPASLDLATLKKRSSDDLGFYIVPSFHGIHEIGELKLNSAAHQCGKIEPGDEIVQINYQTVVGWQVKSVMALFEESPTEVLLTLKKRPRHTKVYGQIYMKPYRLPSKKKTHRSYTRWHDNVPSPRPELLTIPDFEMPIPKSVVSEAKVTVNETVITVGGGGGGGGVGGGRPSSSEEDEDEEEEGEGGLGGGQASPTSARIYLPKPRIPVQRRATITGASPISKTAPINLQQFWQELKLEREWRDATQPSREKSGVDESGAHAPLSPRRKYSSFDSLKAKPDLVSSCRPEAVFRRKRSTDSVYDDVFRTVENSPRNKSTDSDDVFRTPDSKKSSESDDVFDSKKLLEDVTDDDYRPTSLREKIEMFSKVSEVFVEADKARSLSAGGDKTPKPKVPARTFRLSPEKVAVVPQVTARTVKLDQETDDAKKERGRLDKSHSTPAYDFSADQQARPVTEIVGNRLFVPKLVRSDAEAQDPDEQKEDNVVITIDPPPITLPVAPLPPARTHIKAVEEKQVHGQIVETINQLHLLRLHDEADETSRLKEKDCDEDDLAKTERIGKLLETISTSLIEHRLKEDQGGADLSKTISQVCRDDLYAPSPSERVIPVPPRRILPDVTVTTADDRSNEIVTDYSSSTMERLPKSSHSSETVTDYSSSTMERLPKSSHSSETDTASLPPKMPERKPVTNIEFAVTAPATFPRHKTGDGRRPAAPPEPPPRPAPPRPTYHRTVTAAARSSVATRSPKALRKKNPLLAKMRNVSVADVSVGCECQGWLQQRCRKGSGQWNTGWFVIKGTTFYGFRTKEAQKAHCLISLPGFTVSQAEEVKSRKFALKVYHTGTIFYFAAENQDELTTWLDSFSMATVALDANSESILFSESEGEMSTVEETETESCFRGPKMKKLAGLLSGSPNSPQTSRSHHNLTENNSSKSDGQKKFGSLKKLGRSSRGSDTEQPQSQPQATDNLSLDRKYLRFLGKGQVRMVPTAQFRSYRRVAPPVPPPLHPHPQSSAASAAPPLHQSADSVLALESSSTPTEGVTQPGHIITASQHRPADMADYRIASLAKNRWCYPDDFYQQRSVVQDHDTTGFITLEALMLARQDEERRQASLLTPLHNNNINNANNNSNRLLSSHHHPFHHNNLQSTPNAAALQQHRTPPSQEHNNHNQNQNHHNQHTAAIVNNQTRRSFKNHNQVKFYANNNNAQPLLSPRSASSHRRENSSSSSTDDNKTGKKMSFTNCLYKHAVDTSARDYRDGSPEKFWIDSLRSSTDSRGKHHLKKAALYQPPPVAPLENSGLSDQSSHMRLAAFEMLLDQNQGSSTGGRRGSGGTANTPTPAARLKSLFTGKPNDHKTLLGSPRLHKAIFRNSSRGDSGGESLNSPPLSPPEEEADVIPLQKEDPSSSPPTPDYPGLEYPPVFEPGTYSLSDASTILRGRGGNRDPPSNR
ncbi:uncharacterized protein LOC111050039 isoform X2 [Nilaparvata lugens]|uniref:uncharacterized protein LOC111050039 isoform X2 n=1 Tax=Nilaparvata lugens TaxID=108931 RepID=UPI00193CC68B|nr:uncharacterized protein LOC111050039 isoform X2 [Nilaparvata lugens]